MDQTGFVFEIEVMCPPGDWKFFFTHELIHKTISKDYDIITPIKKEEFTLTFDSKNASKTTFDFTLLSFNMISIQIDPIMDYELNPPMKPRSIKKYKFNGDDLQWCIPTSIWAKWRQGEQFIAADAFEHDFEIFYRNLPQGLRNDEKEFNYMKSTIKSN